MAAKAASVVQGEIDVVRSAITALKESIEGELNDYGMDDPGDDSLGRDLQSCYWSTVAVLEKMGKQLTGLRSQIGLRYKTF